MAGKGGGLCQGGTTTRFRVCLGESADAQTIARLVRHALYRRPGSSEPLRMGRGGGAWTDLPAGAGMIGWSVQAAAHRAHRVSTTAGGIQTFKGRAVEVEPYVAAPAAMNTLTRVRTGLAVLGRIHALLQAFPSTPATAAPRFANYIATDELVQAVATSPPPHPNSNRRSNSPAASLRSRTRSPTAPE
jgi:hypothetical protein